MALLDDIFSSAVANMRDQDRPDRGHRIDDGRQTCTDFLLSVEDETEGYDVVEQTHAGEGEPEFCVTEYQRPERNKTG